MVAVVADDGRYASLLEAAAVPTRVSSLTHSFYRYPARFGERFVREAVASFSKGGDVIADPFCGGGTTVVEAICAGRRVVACDVNALSLLLSRVKTNPLHPRQLGALQSWVMSQSDSVASLLASNVAANDALLIGVPAQFRNLLANLRDALSALPVGETRDFARVLLLKTAQWALDGKEAVPRPSEFVSRLAKSLTDMSVALLEFSDALAELGLHKSEVHARRRLIRCSAESLHLQSFFPSKSTADLVITSPPYLGVHVLYNKWQVQGRVETRAPYFLAGVPDLGSPSSYTLVPRRAVGASEERYFAAIQSSFTSVTKRLSDRGLVIQLVSFADAANALPRYLHALSRASLELCDVYVSTVGGLSWRRVPGRRWYTRVGAVADSCAANEVLLVHRKRR